MIWFLLFLVFFSIGQIAKTYLNRKQIRLLREINAKQQRTIQSLLILGALAELNKYPSPARSAIEVPAWHELLDFESLHAGEHPPEFPATDGLTNR